MKVRYTPRALDDLKETFAYLFDRSPRGALNVRMAIRKRVEFLGHAPRQGQATDKPDVRRVPVVRYRHAIYFRVRANEMEIVHIRHTSRQPPGTNEL